MEKQLGLFFIFSVHDIEEDEDQDYERGGHHHILDRLKVRDYVHGNGLLPQHYQSLNI